ncbi:MAG: AI-2E family transporter [Actinomycetaceae bacterium]|nr:AI-2E family transporter [Arcanobacterium sp.]MDD7687166.1 AI-2E family transporter [Actinomycetaceae bacterium]MDY5273062.1 AI-2E family transporter [Arcanobacterium sp.]
MEPESKTAPHGMQIMVGTALFGAMLFALHSVADVFTPLFLALTLVLTVRPITRKLRAHHVPGWLAATIAFLALVVLFVGVVSLLVWAFTPVPQTLVNYSANFERTLETALEFLRSKGVRTADLSLYLNQLNFNSVISWAWNLLDSLRSVGGLLAIVIVALLFFTVDTTTLFSRSHITRRSHSHIAQALEGFEKRVRHYWIISTVFGLIVAVIDVFALTILGVPLPLTWGMWAFITNYIPNLGFVIGVIPPMMMGLVDSGWQTLVWVMVLYSVINVVIQTFIQPKLTGDVVGLSPSVTFVSLVLWTSVVGWLGSLLAVPLTLFFKALLVDSDPRTQWLDVFLISEGDARRREEAGLYDADPPAEAAEVDFHARGTLPSLSLPHRKNRQRGTAVYKPDTAGDTAGSKRRDASRQLTKWSARVRRFNTRFNAGRLTTRSVPLKESDDDES